MDFVIKLRKIDFCFGIFDFLLLLEDFDDNENSV